MNETANTLTLSNAPGEQGTPRLTYTVEEAGRALGISRGLAYEMVREGTLPSLRLGERRIVVPRAALESLLAIAPKLASRLPV